jgi:hypothetical protein
MLMRMATQNAEGEKPRMYASQNAPGWRVARTPPGGGALYWRVMVAMAVVGILKVEAT